MKRVAAPPDQQPKTFSFSDENQERVRHIVARYPNSKQASAVMPLLDLAQRQHDNWLPRAAMDHVAKLLDMPPIRVYEVATFYTMYNLAPVGRHFIQLCKTTPCWLRGSDQIAAACKQQLGIGIGETTSDGKFTLVEVECLGACVNAPMVQINDDYYEDLTEDKMVQIIKTLKKGDQPCVGTQSECRLNSAPESGLTTLMEDAKSQSVQPKGSQ